MKHALPELISYSQAAYVKNQVKVKVVDWSLWYTWYSWLSCYKVYRYSWKSVFDSLNYYFLLRVFKKFGLGKNFIYWIKLLSNGQQSGVINGGFTTPYSNLEEGARQGDPILAYLFILVLEVLFEIFKNNADMRVTTIFNHAFWYTTLADGSTFSLMIYYQSRI